MFRSKHGVPVHPLSTTSTRQRSRGFLRAEICRCRSRYVRPTSATQPTCLTCTRARGSRPISRPRGMSPGAQMDRGTRRFTTSSPASAEPHAQTPGVHRGSSVRSSFWHPCRSLVGTRRPCRRLRLRSLEPRPPSPFLREDEERVDDPVCLPSAGRSVYRALGRSRSGPCDPDLSVNVHEVVRPTVVCRRERSGGHLAMPSERFTLDLSPRLPVCCPSALSRAVGTGLRRASPFGLDAGVSHGLLWAATAYRSLQRMFDARARPRAVNPPPREAPASVRVCPRHGFPSRRISPAERPDDLRHLIGTVERATSFSRYGCLHP